MLRYKLLILRTYHHLRASCWRNYDKAFRRDAAASGKTHWSRMNTELFDFYTSTSAFSTSAAGMLTSSAEAPGEARGTPLSVTLCRSWNAGRCSIAFSQCRFRQSCDFRGCNELHCSSQAHLRRGDNVSVRSLQTGLLSPNKRCRDQFSLLG